MEPVQKPLNSSFSDLFKPLTPISGGAASAPETAPNNVTAATDQTPPVSAGSAASANGTVTAEQALSGLDHTKVSSVSATGTPGQAGPQPLTPGTPGSSVALGGMVSGEWATNIMDAVLPAAIVFGLHYAGIKLRKSEVQLTQAEKQTIIPIMQQCLNSILLNFNNPWSALGWTLIAIYGGKLIEKGGIGWLEKKEEAKQAEALADKIAKAERIDNPAKFDYANQSAADIQAGNIALPGEYPFSEQEIQTRMKKGKCNRDKAIAFLKKQYKVQ